jgi:hypothetical protein
MYYLPAGTISEEGQGLVHKPHEQGAFEAGSDVDANDEREDPDSAPELELGLVLR